MKRMIIVSADGHAGGPIELYRDYLEARYHVAYDELLLESEIFNRCAAVLSPYPEETLDFVDEEQVIRSGGIEGAYNVTRRLAELDREGVAAELVIPATQCDTLPFFSHRNQEFSPELRAAGARAYHRWLADQLAKGDGRLIGVAEPGPCLDMSQTLAELRWVADHGFGAVSVPGTVAAADLPPLHDPYYEPFWATCAEVGLVLFVHAGHGGRQGEYLPNMERMVTLAEEGALTTLPAAQSPRMMGGPGKSAALASPFESVTPRQVFWQLLLGGVFDRYPELRYVPTEVRADWVPATLAYLDERFARQETILTRKPSEYWTSNCFVGVSFIHSAEVEIRDQIGVPQIMFGRDYPHPEGTWPNTWDWIRAAFAGVPEGEARAMLGENAIACYGLDRVKMEAIADRIGPRPEDLLGRGHRVDARKIDHFDFRGGFRKPVPPFDSATLDDLLESDLTATGRGRPQ